MQKCLHQTSTTGNALLSGSRSEVRGVRCFHSGSAHRTRTQKHSRSTRPQVTCQSQPKPVKAAAVRLPAFVTLVSVFAYRDQIQAKRSLMAGPREVRYQIVGRCQVGKGQAFADSGMHAQHQR